MADTVTTSVNLNLECYFVDGDTRTITIKNTGSAATRSEGKSREEECRGRKYPVKRAEILEKARSCVCGERQTDYGTPEDSFKTIAALWNAYTGHDYSPVDVAMMMGLLKIARIKTGRATEDSFVDLAGYAACGGEIATERKAATEQGSEGWKPTFS